VCPPCKNYVLHLGTQAFVAIAQPFYLHDVFIERRYCRARRHVDHKEEQNADELQNLQDIGYGAVRRRPQSSQGRIMMHAD
jgi:hypothetical protein